MTSKINQAQLDDLLPKPPVVEGRDDIGKLPITPQAKAYSRRSGLTSMKRQPKQYQAMVSAELGQKYKGFPNKDVGQATGGGKPAKSAIKDSRSSAVKRLLA